jgi:hypothetical protein
VPALVNQSSLLEAKMMLPVLAGCWARSARIILTLDEIVIIPTPSPIVVEKPILTPTLISTDSLLEILRESLKVIYFMINPFLFDCDLIKGTRSIWNYWYWTKISCC